MSHRNFDKKFNGIIVFQLGPILKINITRHLNLPKIRKAEEEFQNLINSFDSESRYFFSLSSLQFSESSHYLKNLSMRSYSKHQQQSPEKSEETQLYGFGRIKSDRHFPQSRKSSLKHSLNKSILDESVNVDWIEQCKQMKPPHGKAQFFEKTKNEYVWEDVEVIDYHSQTQKYIVKQFPQGPTKKVNRYQLQFFTQKQMELKSLPTQKSKISIKLAKEIPIKIEEQSVKFTKISLLRENIPTKPIPLHIRQIKEIEEVDSKEVNSFPLSLRQKLYKKFMKSKKFELLNQLLDDISKLYIFDMKKCKFPKYTKKYKQTYHKLRQEVNFTSIKNQVKKKGVFLKQSVVDVLNILILKFQSVELNCLNLDQMELPLNMDQFIEYFDTRFKFLNQSLKKQRDIIIMEVQEQLQKKYNFLQSDLQQYQQSTLLKIVKRIDYQYTTFIYNLLLTQHRNLYGLYRRFQFINGDIKIVSRSLFRLTMIANNSYKEMEKGSLIKRNSIFFMENDDLMGIEPNIDDCIQVMCMPANRLLEILFDLGRLESEMVMLLLIRKQSVIDQLDLREIEELQKKISDLVREEYMKCFDIVKRFTKFQYLLQPFKQKMVNRIFGIEGKDKPLLNSIKLSAVTEAIDRLTSASKEIHQKANDITNVGLFTLDSRQFKQLLCQRAQENLNLLINKIIELIKHNILFVKHEYEEMFRKTSTIPSNEEQLIELKLFLDEIKIAFSRQQREIQQIEEYITIIEHNFFEYDQQILHDFYNLLTWPKEIIESIKNNKKYIEIQEKNFLLKLQSDKVEFTVKVNQMQELFNQIKSISNYANIKQHYSDIKIRLQDQISQCFEMMSSFNSRETLFSMQISHYSELDIFNNEFKPYQNLWDLAFEFENLKETWLYGSFKQLNHSLIQQKLTYYINETMNLTSYFKDISEENAQTFARGFRRNLDAFRDILWVIEALAIEAFSKKPALWREFFKDCKIQNFDPKEEFSLQTLINRGVLNVKDQVLLFSQKVEKGWNIEKRLNEMQDKLISIEIDLQSYRETYIFKNYEEVQSQLDEQLNILTMLKSQQHIKMVIGKANQLEYKIVLIQDTLDYGMKCQKHWIYLDPIFSSEDIKQKLQKETSDFKNVDETFRQCMQAINKNKILWDSIDNEKLKNEFQINVAMLDLIQKSLSKYLESKRILFPRFYFVSDEELIEILAQTKDPLQIQKHIFKCFEGINELKFRSNNVISALLSIQGESIKLDTPIDVYEGKKKGNVEQWLLQVSKEMQVSLRYISTRCLKDLNVSKLDFITKWPTQCVLLTHHIKWTRNTETAIRQQQKLNLTTYLKQLNEELVETVQLVRKEQQLIQKTALEAMVVMEVHAKDIVQNLAKLGINNISDFSWISQLRYYISDQNQYQVKMVNSTIEYGFEYLGKITRLVITSLTDRCQRTLLGAQHMHYGGAPEGPAGTGKSETVKDLAKAVAMPCIVFNCSDGLNYIAMGKFFKGLASSGAWCCFDEFNRIDPEVLSVVAQQIFTIQRAVKLGNDKCIFEGEEICLIRTCVINVTMNPGYAGRSELPDNLKILFRPCAMMVPDYAMIAEIYLYSIGFEKARELSSKIVTCLKLCNEQLSPQEHYDFGMRALKAVLSTAKHLYDGSEETICLTSLVSVNQPKFTKSDSVLFLSITQDLFPGVRQLEQQDLQLQEACEELEYQMDNVFIDKCKQLQNNILVRNGVMCIGKTYSGKSAVIQTLGKGLNSQIFKLNPKAVLVEQLYGKLDPDTKQWSDGVVPILIRDNLHKGKVWIVFDGPVNSLWIENLNTVLDDNKKLCLTSGEILKIPQNMCMLFEIEDLSAASPATVSRCGMVYFQPIDWLIQINKLNDEYIFRRIRFLLDHSLAWCHEHLIFPVYDSQNILVQNYMNLLNSFLNSNQNTEIEIIDNYLIFSLIWSIGAALDDSQRIKFNEFLLRLLKTNRSSLKTRFNEEQDLKFPSLVEHKNLFSVAYKNQQWIPWLDLQPIFQLNETLQYHQIIIPTTESARNDYFSSIGLHFLFCGPTGTGKSLSMNKNSRFQITCSGQTNSIIIQRLIETKINKRRRKGYFASEEGHITIFIDDLNMPQREPQGAQPAIELLRQWMDQGGWYDLETKEFKFMCDITFLAAMQPSSGGRNQVTMRYLRYFNLLYIEGFDNNSISTMLQVFVEWVFLKIHPIQEIVKMKMALVNNSIGLFQKIQQTLLPTPTKSHYIYNIRDLFKIFEGIGKTSNLKNPYYMLRLWSHECLRIFSDRLVDSYDQKLFEQILRDIISSNGYAISELKSLVCVQFLTGNYEEITDISQLKLKLQQSLDEYNTTLSQHKVPLILFNMAILHIARITRILSSTYGHSLLIGMGGSGRTSLAKLANYIVFNAPVYVIDPRQWDDQLLTIIKNVGIEDNKVTIIFNDAQFPQEYMLEDVCNIMSHGEIPHLFPPEERLKVQEEMSYKEFVEVCKLNIHVVLCMQPVGDSFRKRLRMFPTIINCSTINWFMQWPDEALESTASSFLPSNLVKMAVEVHHKILEIADRYYQELRRHFYVTPTQYLQMIQTFKQLHTKKTEQARISIDKFETGIEKIIQTEKDVDKIRNILFELQPKLEKATLDNLLLLKNIKKKQQEADQKRVICEQDEIKCTIKREEANELRNLCQTQLNNVLPLLSQAQESLEKISKDDMVFLKSFQKPPESAAIVMEGLCYAFQEDGKVEPKNKEYPITQDFWDYAKKHLLNDKLIKRIKKMKIEQIRAINKTKIIKLELFIQNPLFEKEKVFNASSAAGNLAQWIRAVLATYQAVEIIEPKKALLAEAEMNLIVAEDEVKIKRIALEESLQVLNILSVEYEKARIEKEQIEQKVSLIQAQLNRAEKLTNGLGEEKLRWKKKAMTFRGKQHSIEGDCMLSAAIISYLGVFPIQYRELCYNYWRLRLRQHQVSFSEDYSIQKSLCDPITINRWLQQKLPNDQFSIDNAIILKQSTRWPLMIDPQIQANEWIKNMEDVKSLLILDATQQAQTVQLQLEHAIQIGYAVLLENLGQIIDPLFEPILQQKIIKKQHKSQIKFGDRFIDYSNDFKFYMTTKLHNPHYQPQICLMVTMLNFQVTQEGLIDQMLNIVVKIDEPLKEEQRTKNIQLFFLNKNKQLQTEDTILQLLSETAGDLLDNEELISTLQQSKEEGQEIEERLKKLVYDSQTFNQIREFYKQVAETVANLYFIVNDLSMAEPTYLWSLEFYILLYQKAIKEAAYGKQKRISNIIDKFTHLLYVTINRSLLEKDKLIFRFLLCLKLMDIPTLQIRACVMGPTITESNIPIPEGYHWITQKMWLGIVDLQMKFPDVFVHLCDDFNDNRHFWEAFYNNPQAFKVKIPNLNQFHINMIVKIIKPEQFILATHEMIKIQMGKQFLENMPSTFEAFYYESNSITPLLCLVAPGADPRQDIMTLAEKFDFQDRFNYVSLGQGQGSLAMHLIKQGMEQGQWILLQNCHVANSFMPELEHLYETLGKKEINNDFRLWLTSLPTNVLPHNVVLRALKMTYELPRGLKNNLLRTFYQQDPEEFENCKKGAEYKQLFYSLSLFHAILLERRKFGALGWNIPYNFSQHDLEISKEQLKFFLENNSEIQWDALQYLIAETNYGGRVTDPSDRILLNVILKDFIDPKIMQEGYQFYENFTIPHNTNFKNYIEFIHQLPIYDPPQLFGLHNNAEIYTALLETKDLSAVILQLLPRSVRSSTQNPDKIVKLKVEEILEQLPEEYDLVQIDVKYPLISSNSLNAVLQQELVRYNRLITIMRQTLNLLQKALDGYVHLSDESMDIYNKIFDNQVPNQWSKVSYPSMKLLGAWIIDLLQRLKFINSWIQDGEPMYYWLGGFYFIQSFMTGILQNYARKQKIAFDHFSFEFQFLKEAPNEQPTDGFYVSGIYLDGARFDFSTNSLEEPQANILYYQAPYILFQPTIKKLEYQHYKCPLYNTAQRKGTLSTTGYSINFIKSVKIPSRMSPEHWIKRGVAMVLQLD